MNSETNRGLIAERIRRLRKDHQYSQNFVAQNLSISQAAYSRIENSSNGITAEHIIRLSSLFEVTTDYILKGNNRLIEVSHKTGFLPLIDAKAYAGFVENFKQRINYDDRDWFKIPGFNPTTDQRLFEVEGESMVPTIFPRDVLICQVQPVLKNLISGSLVVLVSDTEVLAKRFDRIEDDKIFLQSDNPDYPEQKVELEVSNIQQALAVHGKISSVLIPNHQVLSNTKINELEETIGWLKKEMFSLSKKMQSLNGNRTS